MPDPNPIGVRPESPNPPTRGSGWLWLALLGVLAGGWLISVMVPRGGLDGTEQHVEQIFREVRQNDLGGRRGLVEFLRDSLPSPLSELFGPSRVRSSKGTHEFAEDLAKLGTNAVPFVTKSLAGDRSATVREVSAMALGNLGAQSAVAALGDALTRDAATQVRTSAAHALSEIGGATAVAVLQRCLTTEADAQVRAFIVTTLTTAGGAEIIPDLLALARREKDWSVRASLAHSLGEFSEKSAVPVLIAWLNATTTAAPGSAAGAPVIPNLHHYEMSGVVEALGNFGGEEVWKFLSERWPAKGAKEIRAAICEAFGVMAEPRALPLLLEALDEDKEIRAAAAEALGHLGDTNAVPALTELLEDSERDVRTKAAEALGDIGGAAAVPTLRRLLEESTDDEVRLGVCRSLGMIGDPSALDAILSALPHFRKNREQALWALGHLGNTNAIPTLVAALNGGEREDRFAAAYGLVAIGGGAASDALAANLADKDDYARHAKACALAMLGRTEGLATVRTGLRAKESWQRLGSTLALARLGLAADSPEWQPILADNDRALRRLGSEAAAGRVVPALAEMLRDSKRDNRQYAARGLLLCKDPAALPALRAACKDRSPVVRDAARLAVNFLERTERGEARQNPARK